MLIVAAALGAALVTGIVAWLIAAGAVARMERRLAEERSQFEALIGRIAKVPVNQLVMGKLLVNQTMYAQGLHATQVLGTVFDGVARHTAEGFAFQQRAAEAGFKQAVRERDEPFERGR